MLWIVAGLSPGLGVRRPHRLGLALALAAAAALVVVLQALAIYTIIEFAVPVAPAFVVLGAAGLVGTRAPAGHAASAPRSSYAEDAPAARGRELERPPARREATLVRRPRRADHEPLGVLGHMSAGGDEQNGASQPASQAG